MAVAGVNPKDSIRTVSITDSPFVHITASRECLKVEVYVDPDVAQVAFLVAHRADDDATLEKFAAGAVFTKNGNYQFSGALSDAPPNMVFYVGDTIGFVKLAAAGTKTFYVKEYEG